MTLMMTEQNFTKRLKHKKRKKKIRLAARKQASAGSIDITIQLKAYSS